MQSLKSTFLAVVLLGLSVGLYRMSDTRDPLVEDGLVPAIDVSDGSDLLVDQSSSDAVSPLTSSSTIGEIAVLAPPDLQPLAKRNPPPALRAGFNPPTSNSANQSSSLVRVPPANRDNVQSFDYPDLGKTNTPTEESSNPANTTDDIRQREVVQSDRDQGLINVLQNQLKQESFNDFAAGQASPSVPKTSEQSESPYQFASAGLASGTAQPIGANDSSITQLAGSRTLDIKNENNISLMASEPDLDSIPLSAAWPEVDRLVAESRYRDALKLLSRFYGTDAASGPQRQRLLGWLDALTGKVIFSAEHHFKKQPYIVTSNESLVDIAERWQVPAQLIYNINRTSISNPVSLAPGTELKVVNGPFDAEIDLTANVMTLFTDGLYAGRYPVRIGISGNVAPGEYRVLAKAAEGFRWRDASGAEYPPASPLNGYGPHWIGLSGSLCIHALKNDAQEGHHGCIGLNPTDAADIFQILSKASVVTIVD